MEARFCLREESRMGHLGGIKFCAMKVRHKFDNSSQQSGMVIRGVHSLIYGAFSTRSLPCYITPSSVQDPEKTINPWQDIPIITGRPFVLCEYQCARMKRVNKLLGKESTSRARDSSNMPSSSRARHRSHLPMTNHIRRAVDIQRVVVGNSTFPQVVGQCNILQVVDRHNILQAVGRLPSLGCRIDEAHTARLGHRNHRSADTGQFGREAGPSSRTDQRRSGLVEGR
jgi:hypothetical protein